jgi:protease-4
MNPAGMFLFQGLGIENAFLKGMFDKLGIEMQLIRGKNNLYKGAGETYIKDQYSPENKAQITEFLGSIYDDFLTDVAASRKTTKENLFKIADELLINVPQDAVKYGLVDRLAYRDEVITEMIKISGAKTIKDQKTVSLMRYIKEVEPNTEGSVMQKIAVIYANGAIAGGEGDDENIGSERISEAVRKARTDDKVKAIVIRINSPGGSALASDVIWREIYMAKHTNKKPVVVSMGDYAASGGYYIAAPADSIFAQKYTITGSIGVFGLLPNAKKLFNEKFGITFDGVNTTKNADLLNPSSNLSPAEMEYMQTSIDKIYDDFVQRVAQGRKRDTAYVLSIAGGRVYMGTKAMNIGLVDKIGTLNDAIDCAARMAKLKKDDYRIYNLPALVDPFEQLQKQLSGDVRGYFAQKILGENYQYIQKTQEILNADRIQARLDGDFYVK